MTQNPVDLEVHYENIKFVRKSFKNSYKVQKNPESQARDLV